MNVYVGNRLPSTYQEVEYIASSGTQYINTGYIPTNNTKVELSMGGWSNVGTYCDLFGARYEWSDTGRGFMLGKNTNNDPYAMFGKIYSGSSWYSGLSFWNGSNHIIVMSGNGIYQDGTLCASLSSATFTSPTNMTIFALNDNGTKSEQSSYKLYYFKIRESGTLVRNFVPCYRKSDSVIGLYDLVNNQFYTNSGTGTFSKGSDVLTNATLKNAYIGEVPPLVLQQIFDFSTNNLHGFTMTTDSGPGLEINTSGRYCTGIFNTTQTGAGKIWKEINATRYWGRVKFSFNRTVKGYLTLGPCQSTGGLSNPISGGFNLYLSNFGIYTVGVIDYHTTSFTAPSGTGINYYLDLIFDNGLYTVTLYDSSLNKLKEYSYQTSDAQFKYAGFSLAGGADGYSTIRVYEYREAYDNN